MSVLTPRPPSQPRPDDKPDVEALEALIEEARRRARRRRRGYAALLIAAAAALLGYFGFNNGGGSARSEVARNGSHVAPRAPSQVESSGVLRYLRTVKLLPGRVTTDPDFKPSDSVFGGEISATFTVPSGWYGYQGPDGVLIGKGFNAEAGTVAVASGGIFLARSTVTVRGLVMALKAARAAGIRVREVSPVHLGGYSGHTYGLVVHRPVSLRRVFGIPGELQPGEQDVIVLRVAPYRAFVIRRFDTDQVRSEIDAVVMSFKFGSDNSESAGY